MATANEIVKAALRLIQVKAANEPISADEAADGLEALNGLIDAWTNESLMQTSRVERTHTLTAGVKTYTIGTGGNIDVTRPVSIENAFVRDISNSDWTLRELNDDQYQQIILKSTGNAYPVYFYYRPLYPLAEITLWPVPSDNLTLHLSVRANLNMYANINQNIDFAPGYIRALKYNLAVEIAPEYRMDIPPLVLQNANQAKERIKDTNNVNIPELTSPLNDRYWDSSYIFVGGGCDPTPPVDIDLIIETGTGDTIYIETGMADNTISE